MIFGFGKSRRVVGIGLDGFPYSLAEEMMDQGLMPNLHKLATARQPQAHQERLSHRQQRGVVRLPDRPEPGRVRRLRLRGADARLRADHPGL